MSELPTVTIGKKTYYFDERLKQIRNVKNPHDYKDLDDMEAYSIKLLAASDYCECCGRPMAEIKKELEKLPYKDGKRKIGVHEQHQTTGAIYDNNVLKNCRRCGHELKGKDIRSENEFMGMCGDSKAPQNIVMGYRCSNCGHIEKF